MPVSDTLYIIGNGFDRYHDIPSDYQDFAEYLKEADSDTYRDIKSYFPIDEAFWWEFEARLADFDVDTAIEYASQFLMPYGAEDWSDSGHHDYQYELDRIVKSVSSTMRTRFADWIRQLCIPTANSFAGQPLRLDPSALFLTFNYTSTLQETYAIDDSRVLHIHGRSSSSSHQLLLGHAWRRTLVDSLDRGMTAEDADPRVLEGNRIIDAYFSSTFKPTERIIAQHQNFFRTLKSVKYIYVMGHSLSEVDLPYFEAVVSNINSTTVRWKISFHHSPKEAQARMAKLSLDPGLISFARLIDF